MFDHLKDLVNNADLASDVSGNPTTRDVKISVLMLFYALAHADGEFESQELGALTTGMLRQMELEEHETGELLEVADFLSRDKSKLDQFIHVVRDNFSPDQKQLVLAILWRVIISDKHVAKLEGQLAADFRSKLGLTMEQGVRARKLAEVEDISVLIGQIKAD